MKLAGSLIAYCSGVSLFAVAMAAPAPAHAQDQTTAAAPAATDEGEVVVTGIRASLDKSIRLKRDAQGVVDAISAEDIGKFPDTNLAESLQRITGVSIDRTNGEGSRVTVRGFGPEFNLVLLDGRQMPTSFLGDAASPPSSRSFDFANLASEGVAAVEVYKSGRASLPTGGIGSTINIVTPRPLDRPGFRGSLAAKGVYDHTFTGTKITPEISGIISKTFADERIGILATGSYQRRKASFSQFSIEPWREGYLGSENNWGSLAMPGDPRFANIQNRPDPTDIYQVPQNAAYDFIDIDRERINGQLVLQARPFDNLTATVDYVFSQNTVDARTNSIGVWFNHNDTASSWTDGPVAGPNFYSETFGAGENKDLAITGALAKNRSINHSIGGNLKWEGPAGLRVVLDAHHSIATSKPTSPYGSSIAVGTAINGVRNQRVDFTTDMPTLAVTMYPGSEIVPGNIRASGNAFRNAYMRDRINEYAVKGGWDFDSSFIESLDFGATYTDNKARSAYGFIQNDTWDGNNTLTAAQVPDSLFTSIPISRDLKGMEGANVASIIPNYFRIDTVGLIDLLVAQRNICAAAATPGTCLSAYTIDRRIREKTIAPFAQANFKFDLFDNPAHLRAGIRYEETKINSAALVPVPTRTVWQGENEIGIIYGGTSSFSTLKGKYDNWLPAFDFDMSPTRDIKLRASYSHTITRPGYDKMQGGQTVNSPLRPDGGGTGSSGNPGLLPYKSKNIDLSAEWYYAPQSYVSVGYFNKRVSNFIADVTTQQPLYGLTNPARGVAVSAARAALGAGASFAQIKAYVQANNPSLIDPATGGILSTPADPAVVFTLTAPSNSDQVAKLDGWEFAVTHSFWDTGFGTQLNYTIVNSDTKYDNALRYTETQFAVTGVSDSANAVLYYDKNGIQARVAYNWRAGFLAGYGLDPYYIDSYGQVDASASWEFMRGTTVFVEAINLTNADRRGHRRANQAVNFATPGYARYSAGLRFTF